MARTPPVSLLPLTLLAALACAAGGGEQEEAPDVIPVTWPTRVFVTNNHQLDIRIFVSDNAQSLALGTVRSFSSETFDLPEAFRRRGRLRLIADPIGERRPYVTGDITFSLGQDIQLIVQNDLQFSTYRLR